jgi:hypothetical protein
VIPYKAENKFSYGRCLKSETDSDFHISCRLFMNISHDRANEEVTSFTTISLEFTALSMDDPSLPRKIG